MNRYLIIGIISIILIVATVLLYRKEMFETAIHPLILSQAPEEVQTSQMFITDAIYIFGNNIDKDNEAVTLALALLSRLQQNYGLPAGDYFTGNYTGLWTCNNNGVTATWVFNGMADAVASTFPGQTIISVNLPQDLTNTYWTCRPNHATGVPTMARFNTDTLSMSLWDGNEWN